MPPTRKAGPPVVPINDRFWRHVERTDSCWNWIGAKNAEGYGLIWMGIAVGKTASAHRVVMELTHGSIPPGAMVDHICRNRACVNPDHLRFVDARTNTLENSLGLAARNTRKTTCPNGHEYDGTMLHRGNPSRYCKKCLNERRRELYAMSN